mgnify:FL=1
MSNVIQFPKPLASPIRSIDPVDELYALSELAERSAEKLKLAIETGCDEQEAKAVALLDRVQRLLKESRSHESGGVAP